MPKKNDTNYETIEQTHEPETISDRVMHPEAKIKASYSACPKCKAFPTTKKIRRKNYELRRCRECGHNFEIKRSET